MLNLDAYIEKTVEEVEDIDVLKDFLRKYLRLKVFINQKTKDLNNEQRKILKKETHGEAKEIIDGIKAQRDLLYEILSYLAEIGESDILINDDFLKIRKSVIRKLEEKIEKVLTPILEDKLRGSFEDYYKSTKQFIEEKNLKQKRALAMKKYRKKLAKEKKEKAKQLYLEARKRKKEEDRIRREEKTLQKLKEKENVE